MRMSLYVDGPVLVGETKLELGVFIKDSGKLERRIKLKVNIYASKYIYVSDEGNPECKMWLDGEEGRRVE